MISVHMCVRATESSSLWSLKSGIKGKTVDSFDRHLPKLSSPSLSLDVNPSPDALNSITYGTFCLLLC